MILETAQPVVEMNAASPSTQPQGAVIPLSQPQARLRGGSPRELETAVIGAGLIGLTVAWELASRGERVDVIEATDGVALETSFANGGLLTPSMADPWNSPGVHRHLLASLRDPHAAMKLRLSALPSLLSWGIKFLRHSSPERHWQATRANYLLGSYSTRATRGLREELGLQYDARTGGSLKVFRDHESMERSVALATKLEPDGLRYRLLDSQGTICAEPELAPLADRIVGALHFIDDEAGDAHLFCRRLAEKIVARGGGLRLGTAVESVIVNTNRIRLQTNHGRIHCRRLVIAAGNSSIGLLEPLGISLPVRPAKGYSVTVDMADATKLPRMPVVDDGMHAAIVPLGSRLRVAGTAEFAGNDRTLRQERIDNLLHLLSALYPELAARIDRQAARAWTGLRPMSADGRPFIGPTKLPGVYVSTGHGHLGWTLAAGSARLLVDLMQDTLPGIDPSPYLASR